MKKHILAMLLAVMVICTIVLAVPAQAAEEELSLLYDDRKELSSLVSAEGEVTISNEVVTSYKVGTSTKDDHVLIYQDGVLYAVGTGTATLTVGDKSYNVTVKPAPISLFMITGHSIGAGQEGNGTQSVVVEAGQAYSSYHQKSLDVTKVDGYGLGWGSENRVGVSGIMRWDSYGQLDAFAPGEGGNTGAGSGFAYRYNQLTGEKVWVINIAIGGSCVNEWLPGSKGHNTSYDLDYYNQTISKFTYAQTILKNEVAAGHYTLSKQGILNFSGYNFSWYPQFSAQSLQQDYQTLWNAYETELTKVDIDGDGVGDGLDMMGMTVAWQKGSNLYDRPATWYMGTNKDFPMVITSAGTISWCADLATFPQIDYTTQSVAPYMPESKNHTAQGGSSDQSLFCKADTTHYSQVGYNAIGLDMGANLAAYFADGAPAVTELKLETFNSTVIGDTMKLYVGQSMQLTPVVKPVCADDLTYEVSGNAEITYPLMIKATAEGTATLTVKQGNKVLKTVNITVEPAHSHCECGGKHSGSDYHTCTAAVTYVPLNRDQFTTYRYGVYNSSTEKITETSESYVLRGGNYFLDGDYTMSSSICVAPGETVNLCLNGHKLTVNARAFKPNGNLNICDCSDHGTGEVYANTTTTAPILYSYSGSVVNFYGGTFRAAEAPKREFAGCIAVGNDMGLYDVDANGDGKHTDTDKLTATVNFYGGKFVGTNLHCTDGSPTVGGSGACLYVVNTQSTLNIYGGEFVGAAPVPVEEGGNSYGGIIGNKGVTNIYGGIFRDSKCNMGAIWTNNSRLTVSGSPVFINNNNADIFLHYCDHFYVGTDGISVDTPIKMACTADSYTKLHLTDLAQESCFVGVHGQTVTKSSDLVLMLKRDKTYCICGGNMTAEVKALSGHVCKDTTWKSICQNNTNIKDRFTTTSTTEGITNSSRYYLKEKETYLFLASDLNLTNEIEISAGYTLHIDLNGYTLTHSTGSASLFRVFGTLTICDSSKEQTGKAIGIRTGTSSAEAACVYALNYNSTAKIAGTPQFELYGGTLTGFNITSNTDRTRVTSNQAGVVQIGNNVINKDAVFNMYGGTICDGVAKLAGNVYLGHGAMNMYGGLIANGTAATGSGGNVRSLSGNTFNMYGGTISGGSSTADHGGNLYLQTMEVNFRGGKITGGTGNKSGGVYLNACTGTVSNVEFENGTSSDCGGNIYITGGDVIFENCIFRGGFAKNWGGNIYATGSAQVTINNCSLLGGCAGANGGNVYVYGSTSSNKTKLTANGGTFEDGKAGFVFTRNEDGTITAENNGTTSGNGGNLYVNEYATAEIFNAVMNDGASVGKNGSNGFGGNIYSKGTLKMDGCTVSGGSGFRGGVVGIRDNGGQGASVTELKNCTFFDNTASVSGSSVGLWADTNGAEVLIENCTFDDSKVDTRQGVISITAQGCSKPVNVTVKNADIQNNNAADADSWGVYMDYGTLILEGDVSINADEADIYMIQNSMLVTDELTATEPLTIFADRIGKIGTSADDKSNSFVSQTQVVTWQEGELLINGLFKGENGSYKTIAEALAAQDHRLILMSDYNGDAELTADLYLDLSGNTLTGNVTGTGTLYGMDSATDQYTTDSMGGIIGTVSCEVASNFKDVSLKRYMAIADAQGYTFHRFYMGITHVNLRPGVDGVGYKAVFYGDDQVQNQVTGYGFTLQLGENGKAVSKGTEGSFLSGEAVTMRLQNFDAKNYGEEKIYCSVYLMLTDGSTIESSRCGYSLRQLAENIAANTASYNASQLTALRDMLLRYADTTSKWDVEALLNYRA